MQNCLECGGSDLSRRSSQQELQELYKEMDERNFPSPTHKISSDVCRDDDDWLPSSHISTNSFCSVFSNSSNKQEGDPSLAAMFRVAEKNGKSKLDEGGGDQTGDQLTHSRRQNELGLGRRQTNLAHHDSMPRAITTAVTHRRLECRATRALSL